MYNYRAFHTICIIKYRKKIMLKIPFWYIFIHYTTHQALAQQNLIKVFLLITYIYNGAYFIFHLHFFGSTFNTKVKKKISAKSMSTGVYERNLKAMTIQVTNNFNL